MVLGPAHDPYSILKLCTNFDKVKIWYFEEFSEKILPANLKSNKLGCKRVSEKSYCMFFLVILKWVNFDKFVLTYKLLLDYPSDIEPNKCALFLSKLDVLNYYKNGCKKSSKYLKGHTIYIDTHLESQRVQYFFYLCTCFPR